MGGHEVALPMASVNGSGLRWSSGALSVALHVLVIFWLLTLASGVVPFRQARPPLVATFVPLPEPVEFDTYDAEAAVRREDAGGGPLPAPRAAAPPAEEPDSSTEMPATALLPISREAAPSGGGGAADTAGDGGTGTDGSGGGEEAGDGGTDASVFARPEWIVRPTRAQMRPYFPRFAVQTRKDGSAALACQVDAGNRARHCYVLGETPTGIGFGRAAMGMSHLFRIRPPHRDGVPQYDAWVRIRIEFEYR
jgi:protein TonB